jgi:hypothetical protein
MQAAWEEWWLAFFVGQLVELQEWGCAASGYRELPSRDGHGMVGVEGEEGGTVTTMRSIVRTVQVACGVGPI